ncbi:arylsulfatase A [Halalkaliarchaeum desulfuricum]|uniref:Arylsulfatase A n=2 Tax=Halalkaliarchaeum desulfuricum TaxID=2055893 RepID=A0A343TL76_9EURY|nr:arylsulfatase A [Halalkaliarchaeum desulfuricum]
MGNDEVQTPNIDEIANRGVTFDRTYANNPMCMPARATMFTGRTPHKHGVRSNGVPLSDSLPTIPDLFQEGGYETYSAGKLHLHTYTLPVRNHIHHLLNELDGDESTFGQRLYEAVETAVRANISCPEVLVDDTNSSIYHKGFSTRGHNPLVRKLEEIHIPRWSDAAVLFEEVAQRAIGDRPLDSFSEDDFEAFTEELTEELSRVFEKTDTTEYRDLQFDPEDFPEAREMWETGRLTSMPDGYYGFDSVDFTGGHVNEIFGEYKNWLKENHPEAYEQLAKDHPDNKPGKTFHVYDTWSIPESLHYNRWIGDRTIDFIEGREEDEDPFFAWCSFPDPHNPYAAPEPWGSMYDPDDVSLPVRRDGEFEELPPFYEDVYNGDFKQLQGLYSCPEPEVQEDEIREIIAKSYGMVSYLDQEVGRVIDALEEHDLREDTIVVFISDHGEMMGDHWMIRKGPFQFDGLVRIPMIWSFPGTFEEGKRVASPTSHIDFSQTLLDLCDVPDPHSSFTPSYRHDPSSLPGKSLRPVLEGEEDEFPNSSVVIENDEDYLGLRVRTLVTDQYKLTIYPGKDYGELYDLKNDPDELQNRWNDPEYADVKQDLYRELAEQMVLQEGAQEDRITIA